MNRRVAGALVSLATALVFSAACAGSSGDSAPPAASNVGATADGQGSPLEMVLGFASEPGRRQFQLIELQRGADVAVETCMRNAGFFYKAPPVAALFTDGAVVGDGSREWAVEQGLGITASFVNAVAINASPADSDESNRGYVASLTTEEAAAYDKALVGDPSTTGPQGEFAATGCWGAAYHDMLDRLALIEEFGVELGSLNTRYASDPRVRAHDVTWSTCMETVGYRYATEAELNDELYARLLELDLVEVEGGTRFGSAQEVEALLEYERQVGVASYDCRASFTAELEALRFDYEQEFLDDNRFRIAELVGP